MKKRGKKTRIISIKTAMVVIISAGLFSGGIGLFWISSLKAPSLEAFEGRSISQSTKIYDRTGEVLLYDLHEEAKRTLIPYTEISPNIKNATVAIEDERFYQHKGVEPSSFLRAVLVNIRRGELSQGGSTITQQVVKNTILTNDKKISRKIKEWVLAVKLEAKYSKEEILAFYLNEMPYGGNIYGVEEASGKFFGITSNDLSLAQAAYLAAIPQAPTFYSPYGNNREALEKRKNLVLGKMFGNKFITQEDLDSAKSEKVEFKKQETSGIKAPHFVMYVKEILEKEYGERVLREKGYKIITTLDWDLQEKAEEIVKRNALENKEKFNAENAALSAIDTKTGDILVMVGSRDYFDKDIDGNFNVTIANRQPGSAFKPFVYATAFSKGYTPETVVFDVETEFSALCNPDGSPKTPGRKDLCYMPGNYDNIYRGPISLRNALAQSINIPAVKTLYLSGLRDSLMTAKNMGLTTLDDINRYGLTLVLGGGEVKLLEMTNAYAAFANEGVLTERRGILRIENQKGDAVKSYEIKKTKVIDKDIALTISNILSDNHARSPAFGERSYLYFENSDVAVKTGTTNDYKDAWIIGYTPSVAIGAWAGNNDNTPMEKKVAGYIVAPLWNEFMREIIFKRGQEFFNEPTSVDLMSLKPALRGVWKGNEAYIIDKASGKMATQYTPQELREEIIVPNIHTILYWVDKNDPRGPSPQNPQNDPQYASWEFAVMKWATLHGETSVVPPPKPEGFDDVHTPEKFPNISAGFVNIKDQYGSNEKISVTINTSGVYPIKKIEYFFNGRYAGQMTATQKTLNFTPSQIETINIGAENELRLVVYDNMLNKEESSLKFVIIGNTSESP